MTFKEEGPLAGGLGTGEAEIVEKATGAGPPAEDAIGRACRPRGATVSGLYRCPRAKVGSKARANAGVAKDVSQVFLDSTSSGCAAPGIAIVQTARRDQQKRTVTHFFFSSSYSCAVTADLHEVKGNSWKVRF